MSQAGSDIENICWESPMSILTANEFENLFRMSKMSALRIVIELLKEKLICDRKKLPMPPIVQFCVCLHFYVGGITKILLGANSCRRRLPKNVL